MNYKAKQATEAIERAKNTTDPQEAESELQKAINLIELLGAQCDQAERRRRYWCQEATSLMRRLDVLRHTTRTSHPRTILE